PPPPVPVAPPVPVPVPPVPVVPAAPPPPVPALPPAPVALPPAPLVVPPVPVPLPPAPLAVPPAPVCPFDPPAPVALPAAPPLPPMVTSEEPTHAPTNRSAGSNRAFDMGDLLGGKLRPARAAAQECACGSFSGTLRIPCGDPRVQAARRWWCGWACS